MAEDEATEELEEESEKKDEPTSGEIEEIARELGWNPNHQGGDREFLSARDFILKSKEIQSTASKSIKRQNREMMELKNSFEAYKKHLDAVYKAQTIQLKSELKELKRRRKEADEDGDTDLVRDLDGQIKDISTVPEQLPEVQGANIDPAFVEWLDDNEWYRDNERLRVYADTLSADPKYKALAQQNYPELLKRVTEVVKEMFPNEFKSASRTQPSVEGATRRSSAASKSRFTYNDLTRDQQDLCDTFVKQGIMTREQYVEDIKKRELAGV